tara:strand:- start:28 stop:477 length:450 start_codon:yes stop_codon:yes gene_type:complete
MNTKQPIDVSVTISRRPAEVWAYVKNIESHTEWMLDADAIRITSSTASGTGTRFDCDTKIGPFRLVDRMEITAWEDNKLMGVSHQGIVSGWGQFSLEQAGPDGTIFRWAESLKFPWYLGGRLGQIAARPVLRWVWNRNLAQLKEQVERR